MTDIYFATNRAPATNGPTPPVDFGPGFNPLGMTFGKAVVANPTADSVQPNQLFPMQDLNGRTFGAASQADIVGGPNDHILVSLHGFDYTFQESILRAANLAVWYGGGAYPVPSTVICLCWPSAGELDPIDYDEDFARAGKSGDAFRLFLLALVPIMQAFRRKTATRRITLLAHSMGNHVLAAGLDSAIGTGPGQYNPAGQAPLFDETILAAADEDTDALSHSDKLAATSSLSTRVHLYYNNQDLALGGPSRLLHFASRLGINGPHDKPSFVGTNYTFVNCSTANPFKPNGERVDPEWHQYYHLVPEVRDDICAMMSGLPDTGRANRTLVDTENYYRLDLGSASQSAGYLATYTPPPIPHR